ncbi:rod shape-determining protein [bacterium]|nr:rod shape-determining protein [Candidatus Elulimicrobium humile]
MKSKIHAKSQEKFLSNLLRSFGQDIGIDLGTANTLVYVKNRGIVINEPSVVAINTKSRQVLAIGQEAKTMVGRTPAHIVATRPLVNGVVSDFEVTEQMLKYFINKVTQRGFFHHWKTRVVVGIPSGVTEVEKRAVYDATRNAGVREVYLIEEPIAAAIGARLPIQEATGSIIVDIGGGTTEIAVMSLGGVVISKSLRVAGDKLNADIIRYVRTHYKLAIGERTAENIKINIGSAYALSESMEMGVKGRDIISGLPKQVKVNDTDIRKAIANSIMQIASAVKTSIEETPPELIGDIMERGIILAGGGALLKGLDILITNTTRIPTLITSDPLTVVVRGTGMVLEDLDSLKELLIPLDINKKPNISI